MVSPFPTAALALLLMYSILPYSTRFLLGKNNFDEAARWGRHNLGDWNWIPPNLIVVD